MPSNPPVTTWRVDGLVPVEPFTFHRRPVGVRVGALVTAVADDERIRGPLWGWPPADRPHVLHERRRRFGLDDESGDPVYG